MSDDAARAEPASFRDPSGHIFRRSGRIFRTVNERAVEDFEFVRATGLLDKLAAEGRVIAAQEVAAAELGEAAAEARYVLEHPRLPFVSYPYEWPFPALKAAALLHLDIQLEALDHGIALSDASAYNVQFIGARPLFIDTLSFRRYAQGEFWIGHRQFCEQFLFPLLLRALFGVPHNAWYRGAQEGIDTVEFARLVPAWRKLSPRILTHVVLHASLQKLGRGAARRVQASTMRKGSLPRASFRRMLARLRKWVATLEPAERDKSLWHDYAQSHGYSDQEVEAKTAFVSGFVTETKPAMVWDVGCNTGHYAQAALAAGAGYVVGFDADQGALELAFARAKAERLDFQPLYLDATDPTPRQGWAQGERYGLGDRADAEAVLALALVHHLAIGHNVPLASVVDWLVGLAPTGIVEFVPKTDPMIQELLKLREDIFPDYDEESFLAHLRRHARIVRTETVSATGRLLLRYERKD